MLDIRYIREHPEEVQKKYEQKGYNVDINHIRDLDAKQITLIPKREMLRKERNEIAEKGKGGKPLSADIQKGKEIKEELANVENELNSVSSELARLFVAIPNIFPDDTPIGDEKANLELKRWGEIPDKNFEIKNHLDWAESRGLVDFERGAKVAGNKFYYLKSSLVDLELALAQFGLHQVKRHGFWPMMVPHLVNTRTLEGAGFSAKGEEKQVYKIEGEDLNLIATAEIPLTGFFADEILPSNWLPSCMAGFSPSYRVEGGAYGKHSRGLFRTHQFNKLELYVYCQPKDSEQWHQKLLAIEEELCQQLRLPYRVVRIASRDLGAPAYKKYDIEYWSPVDKTYRELMSCSNVTDYQARNLNIRYRQENGPTDFVHTLNATALAMSRMVVAIIENFQNAKGQVEIPKALQPYMQATSEI
jgi:seryl-tRNA synthetase